MTELEISNETPLALLSVGQFKNLLNLAPKPETSKIKDFVTDEKEYVFGLSGLAKLLNCSKPTAQAIKNSGKISFMQSGRKLIFNKAQVLFELNNNRKTTK